MPSAVVLHRGVDRATFAAALELSAVYISPSDITAGAVPAEAPVAAEETAYLQYTSGSTRTPAGVMITQENLAVAPMAFVQQPVRWLHAISDFRATTTVVPNFALDHTTTRVPTAARAGLDLSSLRSLGNGSEPIQARSLQAFTDMYGPHGFNHAAHLPGYGLAETTLVVTSALPGDGPTVIHADRDQLTRGQVKVTVREDRASTAALVGAGHPIGQDVRVVDPDTHRVLDDGEVGEVWVQGPNVAAGYFRKEALSAEIFRAESPDLPGQWARTGDLAAYVDGELYIVGRSKDLIIVGGKNHYPADIEGTVQECLTAIRPNGVAVFSHSEETAGEVAVMVIELDPKQSRDLDRSELSRRTRSAVSERHDLSLHEIVLASPGSIPKTSSGKIQRRACAEKYAQGHFARFAPVPAGAR